MKITDILNMYDVKTDALDQVHSRREAFARLGDIGKKLAFAAIPAGMVIGSTTKASANGHLKLIGVLNFALTLEYLEADFYKKGLLAPDLIPAGRERAIFETISKHEDVHVDFLIAAIGSLSGTPVKEPKFDFTAKGAFNPFEDYDQFLALAQAFEDTGVRAYKGQAANLMASNAILTAALQIHSVEARHASEVRRLRGLKGWITQNNRGAGMPDETQAVYNGENNLIQGGVNVTTVTPIGPDGITESFDEPLTLEEVFAIASLFIVVEPDMA